MQIGKIRLEFGRWLHTINSHSFVSRPIHLPFPISTGVVLFFFVLVTPCTVHHKYLIFSSKVDHYEQIKFLSQLASASQRLSMPIHRLVHISEIQENMPCNVSQIVMYLCSQCEFISWLNIMSYSLFTWKRDQNGRLCFFAYAAK